MVRPLFALLPALSLACRAPEAPDEVEEMIVYGFEHYGEEDPRYLTALADKLIPWMNDHIDEIAEGWGVNDLTVEHLAAAGVDTQLEDGIVGALTGVVFEADPEGLALAYSHPLQDEIFTSYVEFEREAGSPDCFRSGDCERFTARDETLTDLGVLGIQMRSAYEASYRWVELSDGTRAVAHRNLGPSPVEFTVDFLAVHQQYSFSLAWQQPDGSTWRAWAMWADGEVVGADLPDTWQITQGVAAMHRAGADIDAWVAAR